MFQVRYRFLFKYLKKNFFAYNTFRSYGFAQMLQKESRLSHSFMNIYFSKYFITKVSCISTKQNPVMNIEELKKYISGEKQFYLKLLANILDSISFESITSEDSKLLLTCCGSSVADSSKQNRDNLCQNIYRRLMEFDKLDLDVSHIYIETCTDNGVIINCKEFLRQLKFEPNQKTFKLLLGNVSEKGDVEQALELLEIMKVKNISANDEMFNKLVLVHTIQGGSKSGEIVLRTMRTAQIPETNDTRFSLLKGVLQRNSSEDLEFVMKKYSIDLAEKQFLEILQLLGLSGNISWLEKIKHLYSSINITRDFVSVLSKICIHLVHMDKSESAMELYAEFVEPEKDHNYGFFILKEMLHLNVDIERIIKLCKHLHNNNLNNYALENLTEIALRHNYTEVSWKLFQNLQTLRPHFFWPLLLDANRKQGEIGIFDVLQKMVDLGVKIDTDTLEVYVIPFCNIEDTKLLIKKLQKIKITVKEGVSSLLIILLRNYRLKEAADLCNAYDVNIFAQKVCRMIPSSWITSKDSESVTFLLQKCCESNHTNNDLVGDFLTETLNSCKCDNDFVEYSNLLELMCSRKLKTNTTTAENLHNICSLNCKNSEILAEVKEKIDKLLDFNLNFEATHIPHPRYMTIDELECHLLELQEKNMETRGVLRKLIQQHANLGHLDRVNDLRQQFLSEGYQETLGMKSALMHNYIKEGYLEPALNVYNEIKTAEQNFKVDNFKVVDLVALLVKEQKYVDAMDILKFETGAKKAYGGPGLEKNCWKLLNSFEDAAEQLKMFKYLVEYDYCKPSNVILGPLIRIHLKKGDLKKSASIYINCANEYKCTPLQLEIIRAITKDQDENLLQNVLEVTKNVHGPAPTQGVLIAALAENGLEKEIRKHFVESKLNIRTDLQKRCKRWIQEGKVEPLITLANVCERLPKEVFDVNFIYNCIFQTYSFKDDSKGALEYYEQLLDKDVVIDEQLETILKKLKIVNVKNNMVFK